MIRRFLLFGALVGAVLAAAVGSSYGILLVGGAQQIIPLTSGTYLISSGSQSVDGGQSSSPWVALATTTSGTAQQWVWDTTTGKLSNVLVSQSSALTFNPTRNTSPNVTLSNSNMTATTSADGDVKVFTQPTLASGKKIFRFTANTVVTGEFVAVGVANSTDTQNGQYLGIDTSSVAFYDNGNVYLNNSIITSTGLSFLSGSIIDVVFDIPNKLMWFRVSSGPWRGTGTGTADPTAGTNGLNVSALTGTAFSPAINLHSVNDQFTISAPPVVSGTTPWATGAGAPGPFLADNDAGLATETAAGDTWTVFASGAGWKARNLRTSNYLAIVSGSLAMSSSVQTIWDFVPLLTLTVTPAAPSIPSTTALGAIVSALSATWSNSAAFTGAVIFASPDYDHDTYSISGTNLVVASNGPGVGSAGGTTQHVTLQAVQIDNTGDNVISNAPSGAPLKNSGGVWSWGPTQAGRQIGGGSFQGDNVLYRNGAQIASGDQMTVDNGGQFYLHNSFFSQWYVWNGTTLVDSSPP